MQPGDKNADYVLAYTRFRENHAELNGTYAADDSYKDVRGLSKLTRDEAVRALQWWEYALLKTSLYSKSKTQARVGIVRMQFAIFRDITMPKVPTNLVNLTKYREWERRSSKLSKEQREFLLSPLETVWFWTGMLKAATSMGAAHMHSPLDHLSWATTAVKESAVDRVNDVVSFPADVGDKLDDIVDGLWTATKWGLGGLAGYMLWRTVRRD